MLEANPDEIQWDYLSKNPNAIHLLEANPDKIDWGMLSKNPNAIHLLEANPDKIDWKRLSRNPNAIHLLEPNQDKIDWGSLSRNPNAIHLMKNHIDELYWERVCINPNAIPLLDAYEDYVLYDDICENPNALGLMVKYKHIEINHLAGNTNPIAMNMVERHLDKLIEPLYLCMTNPYSLHILNINDANLPISSWRTSTYSHMYWSFLAKNPGIFTYDYHKILTTNQHKNACIVEWFSHPRFIKEYLDGHDMDELDGFQDWLLDRHVV